MQKSIKLIIVALLLIFIVALVIALVHLPGLFSSHGAAQIPLEELEGYLQEKYPNFTAQIDGKAGTVTLVRALTITYEQALSHGSNIYIDELAPATYVELASTIAADLIVQSQHTELKVILLYRSTDEEDVFSVCSDGSITVCWETE